MKPTKATLQLQEDQLNTLELPILTPTLGNAVVNIEKLKDKSLFTFDPGFLSTASCESKITYVDGDQGLLFYRGYPIDQLAEQSNFMEVAYLLLEGELPNSHQLEGFLNKIKMHTLLHEQVRSFFNGFRRDAHPMAILMGVIGALSAFYHDSLDINDPIHRDTAAFRLIAKLPTIAAMCYKYSIGQPFVYPKNHLSYTENFLHMMFSIPSEEYQIKRTVVDALDKILTLHADHEQNASTTTVRLVGSTGANPFACIAAGVAALWGPAHGGANEACLNMLYEIGDISRVPLYIEKAKDKNNPFRLMGFGHRVYKNYDPRARVMREACYQLLDNLDSREEPIFKIALELERIALEDDYFIKRKLYPNVDFYSGISLHAIGIPNNMFTVIFALARTVGWIAQWKEMIGSDYKLGRPRQLYTGSEKRDYVSIKNRTVS